MKKIVFLFFAAAVMSLVACKDDSAKAGASESLATTAAPTTATVPTAAPPVAAVPSGPTTSVTFNETEFDFGTVTEGEKVVHVYKFSNTGSEPLVISNAKGSCGCTVPEWPKEPIAPGASSEIRVQFDSSGKGTAEGSNQNKRVTITANTDPVDSYLTIKGLVKKPVQ